MDRSNRRDRDRPPHRDDDRSKTNKNDRRRSRSPPTRDSSKFDRSDRWNDRSRDQKPRDDRRGTDRAPAAPRNPPQARGAGAPPSKPASQRDVSPGSRHQRGRGRGQTDGQSRTNNRDVKMEEESKPAFDSIEDTDEAMQKVMGFAAFRSTKNTKVPGNAANYAVYKVEAIEYRQYMNRKGGFNRPLSPGRNR